MPLPWKSQLKICLSVLGGEMSSQSIIITLLCRFLRSRTIVNSYLSDTSRPIKDLYASLFVIKRNIAIHVSCVITRHKLFN